MATWFVSGVLACLCFALVDNHAISHSEPWEWTGEFHLLPGEYVWTAAKTEGPKYASTSMKLLILGSGAEPKLAWERAKWVEVKSDSMMPRRLDGHTDIAVDLHFDTLSWISCFKLHVDKACHVHIFTEHSPDEYIGSLNRFYFRTSDGAEVRPSGNHHTEAPEVSIVFSKILGISSIVIATLGGFALRIRCPSLNSPKLIGYINVLTGSMFIGMALFHILPESIDHAPASMQTLFTHDPSPIGIMLFVFLGFALVLIFDRVLFDAHGSHEEHTQEKLKDLFMPTKSFIARLCSECADKVALQQSHNLELQHAQGGPAEPRHRSGPEVLAVKTAHEAHDAHEHRNGGCHAGLANTRSGAAAILLMIALSVHAVFEGVLVGTANSVGTVFVLVAIIVAHKSAEAFVVANILSPQQMQSRIAWVLLSLFTFASPLGIALGWIVEEMADDGGSAVAKLIESILNSLAVGTLFYIGMVEVVAEEFSGSNAKAKFIVFMFAAICIFVLTLLHLNCSGHSHADSGIAGHSHAHHHFPHPSII